MKAVVRDAFSGELISTHQMPNMTGICFDVPSTTHRVNINWEYEDGDNITDLQRQLFAPKSVDREPPPNS